VVEPPPATATDDLPVPADEFGDFEPIARDTVSTQRRVSANVYLAPTATQIWTPRWPAAFGHPHAQLLQRGAVPLRQFDDLVEAHCVTGVDVEQRRRRLLRRVDRRLYGCSSSALMSASQTSRRRLCHDYVCVFAWVGVRVVPPPQTRRRVVGLCENPFVAPPSG
jgi:hypothetical protein